MLLRVIELASEGFDVEKLMQLREHREKEEARKAWTKAMNAFKANPPPVLKELEVSSCNIHYKYPSLGKVNGTISAALSERGLYHHWSIDQSTGDIMVTCIITHKMGHSEAVSLTASPKDSKSNLHSILATIDFLKLQTLLAACELPADDAERTWMLEGMFVI